MATVLGLDLGVTSIGWAVLDEDMEGAPTRIIACGSRIFESCVDDKTKTPLNQARRGKRLLRRQIARRRQRRDLVRGILVRSGLWPADLGTDPEGDAGACNRLGDPYRLRAEGLDRRLEPHEFGRVLLAFSKRRGFQSNRKAGKQDDDEPKPAEDADDQDQPTQTDQGIADLHKRIQADGARTLGEWLWKHAERRGADLLIRNRLGNRRIWTERAMLREEFDALWTAQAAHHPALLTEARRAELYRAIFWQRPLKAPPASAEGCAYEPPRAVIIRTKSRSTGKPVERPGTVTPPRAAWAWPLMQRWRYWQSIANLRWRDPKTLAELEPSADQRRKLAEALERSGKLTWATIRKHLGLHKGIKLNLEDSTGDKGLRGNTTAAHLRAVLDEDWDGLDAWIAAKGSERLRRQFAKAQAEAAAQAQRRPVVRATGEVLPPLPPPSAVEVAQDLLVADLLTIDDHPTDGPVPLLNRLQTDWGFTLAEAGSLAKVELERQPGRCCLRAARRMLPHLMAGKDLHAAAQAAGYMRRDQERHAAAVRLDEPPRLRNPVVGRALTELRRVVNAILARHGTPDRIRVEVAREAGMSPRQLAESAYERKQLEKLNAEADDWWRQQCPGRTPKRDDRTAYRLWKRQGTRCLYCDQAIAGHQLTDGSTQIDHILPYSQTQDDSFGNKALVHAACNQAKGNRTPREWLDQQGHAELMARARTMRDLPGGVLKRLLAENAEVAEFHARALNDTRWITSAVLRWLETLWPSHEADDRHAARVEAPRGSTTATLRGQWGLLKILGGDAGAKNRADHRHHALDAVVIACTSRRIYRLASEAYVNRQRSLDVPDPWPTFRDDVKAALDRIIVSHAIDRRIRGAFHDDTAFGRIGGPEGGECFVSRRRIETLTTAMVKRIVDPTVRSIVEAAIAQYGDAKKAAAAGVVHRDGKTPIQRMRVDAGLKRISLFAARRRDRAYRFHELASNHRLEVRRANDGTLTPYLVRMLDHARATRLWERAKRDGRNPLVALSDDLKPLKDGTRGALTLVLHKSDAVLLDGTEVGRIDKLSLSDHRPNVMIRRHTDAAKAAEADRIHIQSLTDLLARVKPIAVSVLGEVTDDYANRRGGQPGSAASG